MLTDCPAHTVMSGCMEVMLGAGAIKIWKLVGVPGHPLADTGVTVMLAETGPPVMAAVKLIFPVPEAGKPIEVLSLTHSNVAPMLPVKVTLTGWPAQAGTLGTGLTEGTGGTAGTGGAAQPALP